MISRELHYAVEESLLHNEIYNTIVELPKDDAKDILLDIVISRRLQDTSAHLSDLDNYLDSVCSMSYEYIPHASIKEISKAVTSDNSVMKSFLWSIKELKKSSK